MTSLFQSIKNAKKKHKTDRQTHADFPIGTRVRVVSACVDFRFFRETETGVVIRNSGKYLGIIVKFDEPMVYEGGSICTEHNFGPTDLKIIKKATVCKHCGK